MIIEHPDAISKMRQITNQLCIVDFAEEMTERVKVKSPVDTGHNKRSVTFEIKAGLARVFTESGYGAYLELGTHKMAARPYFRPAFDETLASMKVKR